MTEMAESNVESKPFSSLAYRNQVLEKNKNLHLGSLQNDIFDKDIAEILDLVHRLIKLYRINAIKHSLTVSNDMHKVVKYLIKVILPTFKYIFSFSLLR